MIGFGQQTYVPDNWFEAYLENNGLGYGIQSDDGMEKCDFSDFVKALATEGNENTQSSLEQKD